jgi:molecular chaperone DnaK (HSP70)
VAFADNKRLIGTAAKNQMASNTENTIHGFKNYLGEPEKIVKHFEIRPETKTDNFCYTVEYFGKPHDFSAVQVAAMMLSKLKADANAVLDEDNTVTGCVIAVPCYFTTKERQSLLIAAAIAELDCFFLIKETSAVAISYGFYKKFPQPKIVAFVDFGMTSMQVCVCRFEGKKFDVVAENSVRVGGRDIDKLLTEVVKSKLESSGVEVDGISMIKLRDEVEKLKKKMSANEAELPLNLSFLKNDKLKLTMGRSYMEEICVDIFRSVEVAMEQCLMDSGLQATDIDSIEIVGGSSRMPKVKEIIKKVFGKVPVSTMNQDEAVSKGCALRLYLSRNGIELIEMKSLSENEVVSDDDHQVILVIVPLHIA